MKRLLPCCLSAALLAGCGAAPVPDAATGDEDAVLATVERFFAAMADADWAAYEAITVAEGMTFAQRFDDDAVHPIRTRTHAELVSAMSQSGQRYAERMWDPIVKVHGPIAMVWTPYEMHVDGEFSHCGIDIFEMLRVEGQWRIANASWTAEAVGCEPGPRALEPAALGAARAAVLAAVGRMTDAMAARDVAAYAATLVPQGRYSRHILDAAPPNPLRMVTNAEDIEEFRSVTQRWDERMWDQLVLVHPPIAAVWAPYDFRIDGAFSHCGINFFQLFHVDGEWKLTNATWTVERDGCDPGT
jgi:hypothetical protein